MSQNDNKNAQQGAAKTTTAVATLEQAAQVAAANGKEPLKKEEGKYPARGRVRAVGDRHSVHLISGETIPHDADKKIDIDHFARAQLDAGKWALVTD